MTRAWLITCLYPGNHKQTCDYPQFSRSAHSAPELPSSRLLTLEVDPESAPVWCSGVKINNSAKLGIVRLV